MSGSAAGGGGVVERVVSALVLRSGVLTPGEGGSGVEVRSERGEPDLLPPGTGEGF